MHVIIFLKAAFLGFVEGVTEFLPISSTGHLIIVGDVLGFQGPAGKLFEIAIQLGAILAVCWLYRAKLIDTGRSFFRSESARHFTLNIALAFLPAVILGVLAYKTINAHLFTPGVVGVALVVGGIAILIIERLPSVTRPEISYDRIEDVPAALALAIGLFQCISMIPGTSRSAATIMGALVMGVTRQAAAEFSFILAIPTMLGATVYSMYKNRAEITADGLEVIAVGFVVAFLVALVVVRWMIGWVSRHGFAVFAYYRIVLGAVIIAELLIRGPGTENAQTAEPPQQSAAKPAASPMIDLSAPDLAPLPQAPAEDK